MLQTMRDKSQGWTAKIIIAVIVLVFAVFGLETLRPGDGETQVASVDGEKISQRRLQEMTEQHRRVLIQRMGGQFDPSLIDDRLLQKLALDNLVQSALVRAQTARIGMDLPEELVDETIRSIPGFQVDGQYQPEQVARYLQSSGLSASRFRQLLSEELLSRQLSQGITQSEFITPYEQDNWRQLRYQTRDIGWAILSAAEARAAVQVSSDDIEDFYNRNKASFLSPEKVAVDYITLSRDQVARAITVSDEQIRTAYETRIAQLRQEAARQIGASMILLETTDEADAGAKALEKADQLYDQLRKGGDFAALARQFSDDAESAAEGGDLGQVELGVFGEAFDKALSALAPGELSKPVQTDYGVMLLKRKDTSENALPTLAQLRDEIEKQLSEQMLDAAFADKARQLADISFEAADLAQPAEQLQLKIEHTPLFGRTGSRKGLARHTQVIAAAFSDEVLDQGHNSKPLEIDKDTQVVLRIREHLAAAQKPLTSVRDDIEKRLRIEKADSQLRTRAGQLVASLSAGSKKPAADELPEWTQESAVSRQQNKKKLPPQVVTEAFRLPHPDKDLPSYGFTSVRNGDIALVRVSQVTPGTGPANSKTAPDRRQLQARANDLFAAYLQALHDKTDIRITGQNLAPTGD